MHTVKDLFKVQKKKEKAKVKKNQPALRETATPAANI